MIQTATTAALVAIGLPESRRPRLWTEGQHRSTQPRARFSPVRYAANPRDRFEEISRSAEIWNRSRRFHIFKLLRSTLLCTTSLNKQAEPKIQRMNCRNQ